MLLNKTSICFPKMRYSDPMQKVLLKIGSRSETGNPKRGSQAELTWTVQLRLAAQRLGWSDLAAWTCWCNKLATAQCILPSAPGAENSCLLEGEPMKLLQRRRVRFLQRLLRCSPSHRKKTLQILNLLHFPLHKLPAGKIFRTRY